MVAVGATPARSAQFDNPRPSAAAVRIDTLEAPIIDGDLSDPVWAKATVLEDFLQRQPISMAPATERTVVRILYDENNIYFGVYAYDSEPDEIVVRAMARDAQIWTGDNILILLDPGLTRRNAYAFQIGPSGGRQDALRLNNAQELNQWDTIWSLRTAQVDDGWIAELAIPFRSISYVEGQSDWGFEFARSIRRKNENVRWADHNPALAFTDVSQAGTLTGITDINQGLGLDIQPYVTFGSNHNWRLPGDGAGITGTAGGNAFYKITPALTGTVTLNTDFSDAPLDARQVNTTRFSLFLPETRDFFLQDAGAFEFGGRGFASGFDRATNNGRPFFSRNIGLADGVPVSLIAGGKISGEYRGFGIGGLSVLTDKTPSSNGQVLSVLRVTRPVAQDSKLGFIVTNGDPTGETENTVAGVDLQLRGSNLLGAETVQADAYYQRSFSDLKDQDDTFGLAINLPNEPWGGDFSFKQVGSDFDPSLGFINRSGIRLYDGGIANRTRHTGGWLRELGFQARHQIVTRLDNTLESRESVANVEAESASNDILLFEVINRFERVAEPFDLPGDLVVGTGDYDWTNFRASARSSQGRVLAVGLQATCCRFFDGDGIVGSAQINFRPNQYFETEMNYEPSYFNMPDGSVTIHVASIEAAVNFTPDMQIAMQAQYDNISEGFGFLGRFRWEYSPGNELFIGLGQSALVPGNRFLFETTQFTVRLSRTFQY